MEKSKKRDKTGSSVSKLEKRNNMNKETTFKSDSCHKALKNSNNKATKGILSKWNQNRNHPFDLNIQKNTNFTSKDHWSEERLDKTQNQNYKELNNQSHKHNIQNKYNNHHHVITEPWYNISKANVNDNGDYDEIHSHINNDIKQLQTQINTLKQKCLNSRDKISVFITWIRKYAKKLSSLTEEIIESKALDPAFQEIKHTIIQFYSMIYNPRLNESLFDQTEIDNEMKMISTIPNEDIQIPNETYELELNSWVSKYEKKILKTEKENDRIMEWLLQKESEVVENKIEFEKQLIAIKEEIDILGFREKETTSKLNIIISENEIWRKENIDLNMSINRFHAMENTNLSLLNELKYRKNIITYWEEIIRRGDSWKTSNSLFRKSGGDTEKMLDKEKYIYNNNIDYHQWDINEELDKKSEWNDKNGEQGNRINNSWLSVNKRIIPDDLNNSNNSNSWWNKEGYSEENIHDKDILLNQWLSSIRPTKLKKESEKWNEEIYELQVKLRKMLKNIKLN